MRPLYSCSGKGEPDANRTRPWDHSTASWNSHSDRRTGFESGKVEWSVGAEVHTGKEGRAWGESMVERAKSDEVARGKLVESGWTRKELDDLVKGREEWVTDEAAVYACPCGQIVAWK